MTALTPLPGAPHPHRPPAWQCNAVFGIIGTSIVLGWLGDALWASLVDRRPLALIALNAKPRYLLLTVNELSPWVFYPFATARLVFTKPLAWLVGAWYGPRAMVWAEGRSERGGRLIRWMERHFARFGWGIVVITSNNVVCILAGSAGMHLGGFMVLAILGTLLRLWVIAQVGDALSRPIDAFVEFVGDHRMAFVAASVVVVVTALAWQRHNRRSSLDELVSLEEAVEEIEHDLDLEAESEAARAAAGTSASEDADEDEDDAGR